MTAFKPETLETLKWMKEVDGKVSFGSIENRYGEHIPISGVLHSEGKFYNYTLECYSSFELGLGGCNCNSHYPYSYEEISEEGAARLIEAYEEISEEENEYE